MKNRFCRSDGKLATFVMVDRGKNWSLAVADNTDFATKRNTKSSASHTPEARILLRNSIFWQIYQASMEFAEFMRNLVE